MGIEKEHKKFIWRWWSPIPRDKKAEFKPQIIKEYETVCNELDKK